MDINIKNLTQVISNPMELALIGQSENLREEIMDWKLRAEVKAARGKYANLGSRLDGIDSALSNLEHELNPIDCGTF